MGTNIKSKFKIDDKVEIKPLKVEGRVVSLWLKHPDVLLVEVRHFINNEKKFEYFYEEELEITKEKEVGF